MNTNHTIKILTEWLKLSSLLRKLFIDNVSFLTTKTNLNCKFGLGIIVVFLSIWKDSLTYLYFGSSSLSFCFGLRFISPVTGSTYSENENYRKNSFISTELI